MKRQLISHTRNLTLPHKAAVALKNKLSEAGLLLSESDMLKLLNELEVYHIEIEAQNEALSQAKEEADAATRKYAELYDLAPFGYFTLSSDGEIIEMNRSGSLLLGKEREQLINSRFGFFVANDAKPVFSQFLEKVLTSGNNESCEVMLIMEGARPIFVHLSGIVSENNKEILITAVDITGRYHAEHMALERFKELEVFYSLAEITQKKGILFDQVCYEFTNILPNGWQYPEITCSRIVIGEKEYSTNNFAVCSWKQKAAIEIFGREAGYVEVGYLEPRPAGDEGPFLKEERLFINEIAKRIGFIAERKQSEDALIKSEEQFHALFENSLDSVAIHKIVTDEKGKPVDYIFLRANAAFEKQTGLHIADIIGKHVTEVFPGIGKSSIIDVYGKVALTGEPVTFEQFFEPLGKHYHIIAYQVGHGQFVTVFQDITERILNEEALRQSKIQLELAHRFAGAGTWDWDMKSDKLTWSDELFALFGLDPETDEATFASWTQAVHPEDRVDASDLIGQSIIDKIPLNSEYRVRMADGQVRWISALGNTSYSGKDEPIRMTGICTDITQRKQSEIALKESERLYRSLFQNMMNSFVFCRMIAEEGEPLDFIHLAVNNAFEVQTGLKNVVGKKVSEVIPGIQETDPQLLEIYRRVAFTGQSEKFEIYIEALKLWTSIALYCPAHGHFVAVFDVITERKLNEEALRESNAYLENLINFANAPIIVWDSKFCITRFNHAFEFLTGYSESEVLGQPLEILFPADHIEDSMALIRQTFIGERWETVEIEILHKDSSKRTVIWNSATLFGPDGVTPVAAIAQGQDITGRVQSEIKLKASEEKFKYLVREMQVGVLLQGPNAEIILSNSKALELLGLTEDQLLGKSSFDPDWNVIHEDGSPFPGETHPVPQAIATRLPVHDIVMGVYHPLKRERVWLKVDAEPQLNEYGTVQQVVCTFVDISIGKQAVEALRESNAFLENLINYANAPIIVWDTQFRITRFNHAFEFITGLSESDVLGKSLEMLFPPARVKKSMEMIRETLTGERWVTVEIEILHRDSSIRTVLWNSATIFTQDGVTPVATIAQGQDITDRKQAEEKIIQFNAELEQRVNDRTLQLENSIRELESFSYSVSHDLRSPLRGIDGWSMAVLEDYGERLDDTGRLYLSRVRHEAQRMGSIIDDLLNLSRVNRTEMHETGIDLSAMVQIVAGRLSEENPGRQLEFVIEPGLFIKGDLSMLEIAITNLLDNACKFTSRRKLARIEFGKTTIEGKPAYFVRDNGAGFNEEYAGKLFGVFQRLHKQSDFSGTGIGLAIVQRIISRHGGRIWAESKPEAGAAFYFTIQETD